MASDMVSYIPACRDVKEGEYRGKSVLKLRTFSARIS